MKKTYKFLVLIIALFFGYIVNASATSVCTDTTISNFNSSTTNIPASDQNISCGYDNGTSGRGRRYSFIEIYHASSATYGDSYYVYKVSKGGASATTYKMMLCTAKFDDNIVTYTEYSDEVGSMLPYSSMGADTMEGEFYPNYSNGDYNDNFYYFISDHDTELHPDGMCPEYAGFKTRTFDDGTQDETFVYMLEGVSSDNNGDSHIIINQDAVGFSYEDYMTRLTVTDNQHSGYEHTEDGYAATTDVLVVPPKIKATKVTEPDTIYEYYESNPCKTAGVLKTLRIVRTVIDIAKVVAPLIIIIVSSIKFGKAAVGGDQNALQDASKYFIKKIILSVVIFLVPTAINLVTDLVYESPNINDKSAKFGYCVTCLSGSKTSCDAYIDAIENNQNPEEIEEIIDEIDNPDYSNPQCELASYNGLATYAESHCSGSVNGNCYQAIINDANLKSVYKRKCNCKDNNFNGLNAYAASMCESQDVTIRENCLNSVRSQAQSEYRTRCEQNVAM
ncbi:MAG: hypothetical protein K6G37_01985 [Bacilli bacterium]|nr:hypothetical protein [Bacilli bacterium]